MRTKVEPKAKGRAGIYVRISRDRANEVSTDVQEKEARDLCKARGWQVVEVYSDVGRSAFKRDLSRPGFERLLADVESGRVEHVVAYKVDRIARNVSDFTAFIDRIENVGATVTLSSQDFDTATAAGRLLRTILASFAEFESELKRERIGGSMAHKAAAGRAHPGGTRLFGYSPKRDAIVAKEAKELRQAADRLLRGWSCAEITRDLNRRGVTTTTGGAWRPQVLARTLRNPFHAGIRDYKGEQIKGDWPPIFDAKTHAKLVKILKDPARSSTDNRQVRHLLVGRVYCGLCGSRLVSRPHLRETPRYVCQEVERGGCAKITVNAVKAEEVVRDYIIDYLTEHAEAFAKARGTIDVASLEREAAALASRQRELAEEWAAGGMTRGEWSAARDVLTERIEDIDRALKSAGKQLPPWPSDPDEIVATWDAAAFEDKRELVRLICDRITVGPGERGRWNPERVKITPHGGTY